MVSASLNALRVAIGMPRASRTSQRLLVTSCTVLIWEKPLLTPSVLWSPKVPLSRKAAVTTIGEPSK